MIEKEKMIREIQLVNLQSLKKLDEICKKHGIKYWAAYGTLIGTIRHQGFIPWDDDLDIAMLHEDFDKLCQVPKEEWGDDCLFLTGGSDDSRHDKLFGRVYQMKSRIQSPRDVKQWVNPKTGKAFYTSLMCDIYIFDYVPDNDQEYKDMYSKTVAIANKKYKPSKLRYKCPNSSAAGHIKAFLKNLYYGFLRRIYKRPWARYEHQVENLIKKGSKGRRIGTFYTVDPYLYDKDDIFPLQYAKFEDMEIPIPKNYDKILRDMYGDYMQFPPENERYHINFIYADLGNGKKYVVDPMPGSLGEGETVDVK